MVIIIKNMKKSYVPIFKNLLKEQFKELPISMKFKDYESENCISFGFKFDSVETEKGFIQTTFTKDDNSKCLIQDHSINNSTNGNGGFVLFMRKN